MLESCLHCYLKTSKLEKYKYDIIICYHGVTVITVDVIIFIFLYKVSCQKFMPIYLFYFRSYSTICVRDSTKNLKMKRLYLDLQQYVVTVSSKHSCFMEIIVVPKQLFKYLGEKISGKTQLNIDLTLDLTLVAAVIGQVFFK